jgi:hypothetical protein
VIDLEWVNHTWENPDGSVPFGSIVFTLSGIRDDEGEETSVTAAQIIAPLIAGQMSQQLVPNVNPDLTPNGTFYIVRERIPGQAPQEYPITVPTGGPFDLYALRAAS